jgi:fused signal recognition particle receptor
MDALTVFIFSSPEIATAIGAGVIVSLMGIGYFFRKRSSSSHQVILQEEIASKDPVSSQIVEKKIDFKDRLSLGLGKSRRDIWGKIYGLISSQKLDQAVIDQIEEILFSADISPNLVAELTAKIQKDFKDEESPESVSRWMANFFKDKISSVESKISTIQKSFIGTPEELKVIMIVGVNGAGKTTTIGKLATRLKNQGQKVFVGACDTFRAAAVDQLQVWCERAGVEMVRSKEGADPSGVAYEALLQAKNNGANYCILDTAGRLHTKANLMEELTKTKKVLSKVVPDAPHYTFLVVDAITGQNAMRQAEEFNQALKLDGLIFTKCDGSAKAGSGISIMHKLELPIIYIGVGEKVEDLDLFNLNDYLAALTDNETVR